ncbi:TPA: hypothetical protein I7245_21295 [Vibrio vulnificus]|uniref:hypothetical protein n=1 Tax=Vibrio vulnificus TaxID=672 RepID=UPI001A2C15EB|nr:hypothetical protein [Vibrio vulnificus]WHE21942.1 hypothetical protein PVE41_01985 [Vibrio vulnificus]HAS6208328.1 hypothetical protein [Vibrio vulnificus]HAS6336530.1 hypothetical protein [Vibrio vulnificus]HAT8497578.1 hypothetical protein [Vibrio vulnificus]HDY7585450.1 hypothetical protein [Vibrio vulnificus]
MRACWKNNKSLKPKVILEKIDSLKKVVDGNVTFSSFEYHDAKAALESMINFPNAAKDLDKSLLVTKAIWEVAKAPITEANAFINQINQNIRDELATRENTYFVLTSISVTNIGIRSIRLDDCLFRFYQSKFPTKFNNRKSQILSKSNVEETESIGYTKVVIELSAKSEQLAANKGLRVLDQLRAMYCLFLNNSNEFIGNQWEPINRVRLGEYHTVHREDGTIYPDMFWYDPTYKYARPVSSGDISIIVKNIKYVITRLGKLDRKYKDILVESLLRYVRAFDEQNQNTAVMRAWGALEGVAAPNESNCDSVTRRCAFLFDEHEYHKQILEHVREYRNRNVHAGEESKAAKNHGFQIQRYFKQLLLFHIHNAGNFDEIQGANRFLDLPTSKVSLLGNQKIIKKALKFRGYVA